MMFSRTLKFGMMPSSLRSSGQKPSSVRSGIARRNWSWRFVRRAGFRPCPRVERRKGGGRLGSSGTEQAGQADDFAGLNCEVHRFDEFLRPRLQFRIATVRLHGALGLGAGVRVGVVESESSLPIIREMSWTRGSSRRRYSPTNLPLRNTVMRSEIS